jgi:signal transduction histidine kinase/predicted ATPase
MQCVSRASECSTEVVSGEVLVGPCFFAARISCAGHLSKLTIDIGWRSGAQMSLMTSKLYGRSEELQRLKSLASAVKQGASGLALVRGQAGTGKSALAAEFGQLLGPRWLVLNGRYEREASERPYRTLSNVMSNLVHAALRMEEQEFSQVRRSISSELQDQIPLMLKIAPDLHQLLDSSASFTASVAFESRERVQTAICHLFKVVARFHPIVLCLDDLHWAGADSLAVATFLAKTRLQGVLLLYAYRPPSEVPALQSLESDLQGMESCLIELAGLKIEEVRELLEAHGAVSLAEVLLAQTRGNPFFLHSVLSRLKKHGYETPTPEVLRSMPIGDNLAEVVLLSLGELPPSTSTALSQAACYGAQFELNLLAEFRQETTDRAREVLDPALESGFLKLGPSEESFSFAHDAFQEAALAGLGEAGARTVHLQWGRLLYQKQIDDETAVAEQLLRGLDEMTSDVERELFARLALNGGREALAVSAFDQSLALFQGARRALGEEGRQRQSELHRDLCMCAARAALALGRTELVHELVDAGAEDTGRPIDELDGFLLKIQAWLNQGQNDLAVEKAEAFMCKVGRQPLRERSPLFTLKEFLLVARLIGRRKPADLKELPVPTDPLIIGLQDLDMLLFPIYARLAPRLIPAQILSVCRMVLTDGVAVSGARIWTGYGLLLCSFFRRYELGTQYAQLSLDQLEGLSREGWCYSAFFANFSVFPWTKPLYELCQNLREVARRGLEWGVVAEAFMASTTADVFDYFLGLELSVVAQRTTETRQALDAYNQHDAVFFCDTLRWAVARLQHDRVEITWNAQDEMQILRGHLLELHVGLVLGHTETVTRLVQEVPKALSVPFIGVFQFVHWTYFSVALSWAVEVGAISRFKAASGLRQARKALDRWSLHVPERKWRCWWVKAAELKSRNDHRSVDLYDKAIASAVDHGFLSDAALMCEQVGAFCLRRGSVRLGQAYQAEALERYKQWGAWAKVAQLHAEVQTSRGELVTLARASEIVTGQGNPEQQLQQLLELAVTCTGSQRGLVFAEREEGTEILAGEPDSDFPASLLGYVRRTGERVVLAKAGESRFGDDPYILAQGSRGLVCWPLGRGNTRVGTIFLENNSDLLAGQAMDALSVLCAQIGAVIKNINVSRELHGERNLSFQRELRNVELEAGKNSLTAFLGIASHDLKAPLASIKMWLKQMGNPTTDLSHAREQIENACLQAERLIGSYLDAVAVESGCEIGLRREWSSLDTLVEEELERLLQQIPENERALAALSWDLEPVEANIDRERFRQVVDNLVGNALTCCPTGTPISVSLVGQDDTVCLVVEDQGPGIPEALHDNLFRAFVGSETTESGSGLGLWICRQIVEAHGGEITLDSTEVGTRFRVEL